MKLDNQTKWSTDDLRAIISAALNARDVPSTGLEVHVVPSKEHITGRATIGKMCNVFGEKKMYYGRWMLLRIPNPAHIAKHVETEEAKDHVLGKRRLMFARVVEHEVAHLQGLRHPQMSDALRYCTQDVPWLGELALGEEMYPDEAVAEKKAAARADRLEHARSKLKLSLTREKRATTLRKKWERRVRALERTGGES